MGDLTREQYERREREAKERLDKRWAVGCVALMALGLGLTVLTKDSSGLVLFIVGFCLTMARNERF